MLPYPSNLLDLDDKLSDPRITPLISFAEERHPQVGLPSTSCATSARRDGAEGLTGSILELQAPSAPRIGGSILRIQRSLDCRIQLEAFERGLQHMPSPSSIGHFLLRISYDAMIECSNTSR